MFADSQALRQQVVAQQATAGLPEVGGDGSNCERPCNRPPSSRKSIAGRIITGCPRTTNGSKVDLDDATSSPRCQSSEQDKAHEVLWAQHPGKQTLHDEGGGGEVRLGIFVDGPPKVSEGLVPYRRSFYKHVATRLRLLLLVYHVSFLTRLRFFFSLPHTSPLFVCVCVCVGVFFFCSLLFASSLHLLLLSGQREETQQRKRQKRRRKEDKVQV